MSHLYWKLTVTWTLCFSCLFLEYPRTHHSCSPPAIVTPVSDPCMTFQILGSYSAAFSFHHHTLWILPPKSMYNPSFSDHLHKYQSHLFNVELDYCNSLLIIFSPSNFAHLKSVSRIAACVILNFYVRLFCMWLKIFLWLSIWQKFEAQFFSISVRPWVIWPRLPPRTHFLSLSSLMCDWAKLSFFTYP